MSFLKQSGKCGWNLFSELGGTHKFKQISVCLEIFAPSGRQGKVPLAL